MFSVQEIALVQYKNHPSARFVFGEKIIGICGPNASGKTNLLDAIYTLCLTKSHFNSSEAASATHGMSGYRLAGNFSIGAEQVRVIAILRETGRREIHWNNVPYRRALEHIGRLPVVMIAPDDIEIILGGSEVRRKTIDGLLSQLDSGYLHHLLQYNRLLKQRNALLKQPGIQYHLDTLDAIDLQMPPHAAYVVRSRYQMLQQYIPLVKTHYEEIAGKDEKLEIHYKSCIAADEEAETAFSTHQKKYRPRDIAAGRSLYGIHREELSLLLGENSFKQTASQGQKKSLLFSLKLAEYDLLNQHNHFPPLLLLDDVFEKLDNDRVFNLLRRVCHDNSGQVLITDTDCRRLSAQIEKTGEPFSIINLEARVNNL